MKYDEDHVNLIISSLENGDGRVRACQVAQIDYQTFLNWMNDPAKIEFLEQVKRAELGGADRIKDLAKRAIISKFAEQWTAAAWWLERNFPEEYRNRTEIDANIKEKRDILKTMFDSVEDETQQES